MPELLGLLPFIVLACIASALFVAIVAEPLKSLFSSDYPYLGWSDWVLADARALSQGHLQYGDPSAEYVGGLYTPGYIGVVAIVLAWLSPWVGWAAVISAVSWLCSVIVIAAVASPIRYDRSWRKRSIQALRFVFLLGCLMPITWYLFTAVAVPGFLEARPDQFAWLWIVLALSVALTAVVAGNVITPWRALVIGIALTVAIFSKQTTVGAAVVIGITVLIYGVLVGSVRTRQYLLVGLAVSVIPVCAVVVLQVLSDGFFLDEAGFLATRHIVLVSHAEAAKSLLSITSPAFAAFGAVLVVLALSRPSLAKSLKFYFVLLVLGLVIIATFAPAVVAHAKQGGDSNQAIGIVLSLLVGVAVLLSIAQIPVRLGMMALLLLVSIFAPLGRATPLEQRPRSDIRFAEVPPEIVEQNRSGKRVFNMYYYPSLGIIEGDSEPPGVIFTELVAGGYSPRSMISGLLDGRFSLALPQDTGGEGLDLYASNFGRRDESVAWKVNWILDSAYRPSGVTSGGATYLEPRQDLRRFRWVASCFSPWGVGERVRIVQVAGKSAWCLRDGSLRLEHYKSDSTVFSFWVSEPTEFLLIHRGGNGRPSKCPHPESGSGEVRMTLTQSGLCQYQVVKERGGFQLQVDHDLWDDVRVKNFTIELVNPQPGDPALTLTRR